MDNIVDVFNARSPHALIVYLHRESSWLGDCVSRIWDALKQAEREKSQTAGGSTSASVEKRDRRAGLNHSHRAQLLVYGSDAEGQPFHEDVETIHVSDEGCLFELETSVLEGQRLFLVHLRTEAELDCRILRIAKGIGRKARIAVAFASPAPDFWRRI
jgi:hypothetical protein